MPAIETHLSRDTVRRLRKVRHVALDMDGTVYLGNELYKTTPPFLKILSSLDISYSFLTNNSSAAVGDYLKKLSSMGIRMERKDIYTSALFTADYLTERMPSAKKLYVLGTESLKLELCSRGFEIVGSEPDAVVAGFDTELTHEKLCRAAHWISAGAVFISTHPDRICPTNRPGFIAIDCGWITDLLERVTGVKSLVLGKPKPEMLIFALKRLGFSPEETLMAGDRFETDIQMAVSAGARSAYISSEPPGRGGADITVPNLLELGRILEKTTSVSIV
jgi:NagD protein